MIVKRNKVSIDLGEVQDECVVGVKSLIGEVAKDKTERGWLLGNEVADLFTISLPSPELHHHHLHRKTVIPTQPS